MRLQLLASAAQSLLDDSFREGEQPLGLDTFTSPFPREIPLTSLLEVVQFAMKRFDSDRPSSDGWLAPRVHATLRLTRRDAADQRIWNFLSIVTLPEYVRWRWELSSKDWKSRFIGPEYLNALARLWWGAELTRNANDYSLTHLLFERQDFQNSWARLDLFHHRPTAIATARYLSTLEEGKFASSDQIRDLARSFNMSVTTTMLDALAADPGPDAELVEQWCLEPVDETLMYDSLPDGAREAPVCEAAISQVTELLGHTSNSTNYSARSRTRTEPKV